MSSELPLPNVDRVVSLETQNLMRVKAVRIEVPKDQPLVIIGGPNEAGKTSVLQSIAIALGGKTELPDVPVRIGQKRGFTKVDLGEIIVTRTFTKEGGGTLTITGADGQKFRSPQDLLDKLTSKVGFDPISFMRQKPPQQRDTLRSLVNLDTSAVDKKYSEAYSARTLIGRDVDRLTGLCTSLPQHAGVPEQEVSSAAVLDEIKAVNAKNKEIDDAEFGLKTLQQEAARAESNAKSEQLSVTDLETEIAKLQKDLAAQKIRANEAGTAAKAKAEAVAARQLEVTAMKRGETTALEKKLSEVEATNQKVRANRVKETARKELKDAQAKYESLTNKLTDLESQKNDMIAAVKYPVPGLSVTEDGVMFNSLPLGQASAAQQLRISVAIAAAMNPKLKVMLIRDGSLMDKKNIELLRQLAIEFGIQVWIERVVDADDENRAKKATVIITDGTVEGAEPLAEEAE